MKESKYNFYLKDHTGMILYNAKSDEVVALNPQLADFFEKNNPDTIKELHPELYTYLVEKNVFVPEDIDEVANYLQTLEREEENATEFTITVNPTLACNMKCWYCYETHQNKPAMSVQVRENVVKLIRTRIDSGKTEKLNLSFFGGEPLLCFEKVVRPIIKETVRLCQDRQIILNIHFTTNAYLLTENVLEQIKGLNVSFQITIDGNRNVHDSVRKTRKNEPTYTLVIKHIHLALTMGFTVGVRFNYTKKTLPTFIDVLSDFQNLSSAQKKLLNFTFQRVWQDRGEDEQIEKKVTEIEQAFEKAGLYVNPSNDYAVSYCYADKKNTVVVNYNGDLYKCTARDFTPKNREGVLTPDGNFRWNEKYDQRLSIRYGNKVCRECRIYPICHGGCSQMKLENPCPNSCPKGYNNEQISRIQKGRALFILNQYKKRMKKAE